LDEHRNDPIGRSPQPFRTSRLKRSPRRSKQGKEHGFATRRLALRGEPSCAQTHRKIQGTSSKLCSTSPTAFSTVRWDGQALMAAFMATDPAPPATGPVIQRIRATRPANTHCSESGTKAIPARRDVDQTKKQGISRPSGPFQTDLLREQPAKCCSAGARTAGMFK